MSWTCSKSRFNRTCQLVRSLSRQISTAAVIEERDSLTHVTLMFLIEQELNIQFAGEEFARLEDVGSLKRLVESKVGVQS